MADENDQRGEKPNDASSRAGQFLEGPVTQAFCSPDQAGYRCATQTPGCEPTGFTGQCTKQPEVGGGWPCITAMPFCAEPTGFTGKCTHHPWPNPTRYVGCTVLHCPTNDLTHQPHICRVVEEGLGGGAPQAKGDANAEAAAPQPTALLGCGYTQTWGLCPTHLLGCGYTKQWGPHCPPAGQAAQAQPQQQQQPPQTWVNGACTTIQPTQPPDCGQVGGWGPSAICATQICVTWPNCWIPITRRCPEFTPGCPWITPKVTPVDPGPWRRAAGGFVGAAAPAAEAQGQFVPQTIFQACWPTPATHCFICPPYGGGGGGTAATVCTQFGGGGGGGEQAGAAAIGTWPTPQTRCFVCDPMNAAAAAPTPSAVDACPTRFGCPTYPNGDCTFFGCNPYGGGYTQNVRQCPSIVDACPSRLCGGGGGEQVGAAAMGTWPTPQTRCFVCDPMNAAAAAPTPSAVDACPTRLGCPTYPNGDCTFFGCHPYGGHTQNVRQCPSIVDACPTRLCGGGGGGEQFAAAMPTPSAVDACPTRFGCPTYPNGDCTFFGCHPYGGHTQNVRQCPSIVDACPSRLCGGGGGGDQVGAAAQITIAPTPATRCFICPPPYGTITIAPTPATRCFICPPPYGGGGHTAPPVCPVDQVNTFFPCTRIGCDFLTTAIGPRCMRTE